jgi:chromosome segregation ATPase
MGTQEQEDLTQPAAMKPPPSVKRIEQSMGGFKRWLQGRTPGFGTEAPPPPDALRDTSSQLASRIWDIALQQARDELRSERAAVHEQLVHAHAQAEAALHARDQAHHQAIQTEKRLAAAEQARRDVEERLAASRVREDELKAKAAELEKARHELEQRLAAAGGKQGELEKRIAALQSELANQAGELDKQGEKQREHLEKVNQHYAALETQLGALLAEHKAARQKLGKPGNGRQK